MVISAWVSRVVYLDDLDPECLVGNIHLSGDAYSKLWGLCDREEIRVIGDIHTHPGQWVGQSPTDKDNPMVARRGHLAVIAPDLATRAVSPPEVGLHEYLGDEGWRSGSGAVRNAACTSDAGHDTSERGQPPPHGQAGDR